jgi:hypothetical protein
MSKDSGDATISRGPEHSARDNSSGASDFARAMKSNLRASLSIAGGTGVTQIMFQGTDRIEYNPPSQISRESEDNQVEIVGARNNDCSVLHGTFTP